MYKDKVLNWLFATSPNSTNETTTFNAAASHFVGGYAHLKLQLEELKRKDFLLSIPRYATYNAVAALFFGVFIAYFETESLIVYVSLVAIVFLNLFSMYLSRSDLTVSHIAPLSKLHKYAETTAFLQNLGWITAFMALELRLGIKNELTTAISLMMLALASTSLQCFRCYPNLAKLSMILLLLSQPLSSLINNNLSEIPQVIWATYFFVYLILNSQVTSQSKTMEKLMLQQALALNEKENTQHFFDSIPGLAFSLNENHEIIQGNAKFYSALAIQPQKHFDRQLSSYKNASALYETYEKFASSNQDKASMEILFSSGFVRGWHLISFKRVFGTARSVIVMCINIDSMKKDQIQLEEQRKHLEHGNRLASLGKLAGGVAHEINNPLAIIHGLVSLIRLKLQANPSTNIDHDLKRIEETGERIAKVTQSLLSLTQENRLEEEIAPASLNKVLQKVEIAAQEYAKKTPVSVTINLPRTPIFVQGNELLLEQVISNLVSNGIDAVQQQASWLTGEPPLAEAEFNTVITRRWVNLLVREQKDEVIIEVTDSGAGIPQAIASRMFEPFFTTKDVGAGKGLGLCVSRSILRSFAGSLKYNEAHPNTCFEVILRPVVQNAASPAGQQAAA